MSNLRNEEINQYLQPVMKRISQLLSLFAAVLLIPAMSSSAQDFERTFSVSSGGELRLDLETGGSVVITGWNRSEVEVKVYVRGRDDDEFILDIEELSNGVSISTEFERRNSRADVEIEVMVPSVFNVEVETTGGEISVNGVEGKLVGETMGGELELSGLTGTIDFETMGGEILLEDSDVDGRISTMGGEITVTNVTGNVKANTMGGEVSYNNVRQRSKTGRDAEVQISTMGGEITVDRADYGADLKTMGGEIHVGSAKDHVKVSTMGGEISIEEIDGWVEASTMGGDIEVNMVGNPGEGDRHVDLSSMGGDIVLTVPDGLSMEIEAEITVTGRYDIDEFKVQSDFDLKIEQTAAGERRRRDDALIVATGTVGSGKHRITIKTTNGDITIRRGR
ncbi:MAG: hypothetical protein BMS9Abin05_0713 [Rhodothermia bacterium]|nr:MAG: hypothetical protein BMS9Abin05_0713 [Rhodothermia bacterium]